MIIIIIAITITIITIATTTITTIIKRIAAPVLSSAGHLGSTRLAQRLLACGGVSPSQDTYATAW